MSSLPDWVSERLLGFGFAVELGLAFVGFGLAALVLGDPVPFDLEVDASALFLGLAGTAPTALAAWILTSRVGRRFSAFDRIYRSVRSVLAGPVVGFSVLDMLVLAGAAGIGEEVLFRGVGQEIAGIWVASAVLGLLHALTPAYFALATLMGLYLGWLYEATGNLFVPIVVHWLYDTVALLLLRREFRADAEAEAREGPEAAPEAEDGGPKGEPPPAPPEERREEPVEAATEPPSGGPSDAGTPETAPGPEAHEETTPANPPTVPR